MSLPSPPLAELLRKRREVLREAGVAEDLIARLVPVLLASDYAFERLRRQPLWAAELASETMPTLELPADREADWPDLLRRYRHLCSLRLIARDLCAEASLEATLAESTRLADHCTEVALAAIESLLIARHGQPRDGEGRPQRLVVFALGKLGGGELNFSSDIDLVFAYRQSGSSDGARPLDNETWFLRAGQKLIALLGDTTAEGFGFRVDMRLRPFGSAGRLALSFTAMEHYFQREGRDWERYAWVKARPIAGDIAAGEQLLTTLRPFVYRRYLDFTAFAGLREMKAMIEADVQRRDLAEHLKLGPGGIREIEFVVQLQQLIRGGREVALRARGLLPALAAVESAGHIEAASAQRLRVAYCFLRRLENRLQMMRDEQVHSLPDDPLSRERLALGLGYADWDALSLDLQKQRDVVSEEFARVFEARAQVEVGENVAFEQYWRQIESDADGSALASAGMADASAVHTVLRSFVSASGVRALSARGRARLDRLLPPLLAATARSRQPTLTLHRLLRLLHAILGRSSYLALLEEQPAARERLIDVMARSALLAERLAEHPLLLDDLLDGRAAQALVDRQAMREAWQGAASGLPADDVELRLNALNELRQSLAFRIAREALFERQSALKSATQLAGLADVILEALLTTALSDLQRAHGALVEAGAHAGIAIIGYGSLGGAELGFGSDLDLVFLFDSEASIADSNGVRPLEATRYQQRVVQKLLALLATQTPAGRLYEADLRLRPDGSKGMLLCSLRRFAEYQIGEAWAWEHQALVRARFVAGDTTLGVRFEAVRAEVLARPRACDEVCAATAAMRARMRVELDRSRADVFDLKQGVGGLVDLEFLLQAMVLAHAHAQPGLLSARDTPALIDALATASVFAAETARHLVEAHACLLAASLECTLDGRPRLAELTPSLRAARSVIVDAWQTMVVDIATRHAGADPMAPGARA
ncbi:MAG: bifunctional [glutamate--ammonia ligase]-adenylyl-L-tyrosine phosphorylase/[glutamate--ammonia-ligase] adenylyltransferase [Pseudomarimonas sp.]